MNPIVTGVIAAAALLAAFIGGSMIEIENGEITLEAPTATDGPLEQAGEALDDAVEQ